MKSYSIYSIKNSVTGHIYIGQTNSIGKRFSAHRRELERNVHYNYQLQNSFNKYGLYNFKFEVIETNIICPLVIDTKEKYYIKLYNSMNPDFGFNRESGGSKNKTTCIESRKARSESMKGNKHMFYGVTGVNHPRTGKKHTEEWKSKFKEMRMGHKHSDITKKKISESHLGSLNYSARSVINIITGEIFSTLNDAAASIKMNVNTLGGKLRGTRKNNTNLQFNNKQNDSISESGTRGIL